MATADSALPPKREPQPSGGLEVSGLHNSADNLPRKKRQLPQKYTGGGLALSPSPKLPCRQELETIELHSTPDVLVPNLAGPQPPEKLETEVAHDIGSHQHQDKRQSSKNREDPKLHRSGGRLSGAQKLKHARQRQELRNALGFVEPVNPKLLWPDEDHGSSNNEIWRKVRQEIKELKRVEGTEWDRPTNLIKAVNLRRLLVKWECEQDPKLRRELLLVIIERENIYRHKILQRQSTENRKPKLWGLRKPRLELEDLPIAPELIRPGASIKDSVAWFKYELMLEQKREQIGQGNPEHRDKFLHALRITRAVHQRQSRQDRRSLRTSMRKLERSRKASAAIEIGKGKLNIKLAMPVIIQLESTWKGNAAREAHGFILGPPTTFWDTRSMGCTVNDIIHTQLPPGCSTVSMTFGSANRGLLHILSRHSDEFLEHCSIASEDVCEFIASHIVQQPVQYSFGPMFFYKSLNPTKEAKYLVVVLTKKKSSVLTAYPSSEKRLRSWKRRHAQEMAKGIAPSKVHLAARRLSRFRAVNTRPLSKRPLRTSRMRAVGKLIKPYRVKSESQAKIWTPGTIVSLTPVLPSLLDFKPHPSREARDQSGIWSPGDISSPALAMVEEDSRQRLEKLGENRSWKGLNKTRSKETVETAVTLGVAVMPSNGPGEGLRKKPNEGDGKPVESSLRPRNLTLSTSKTYTEIPAITLHKLSIGTPASRTRKIRKIKTGNFSTPNTVSTATTPIVLQAPTPKIRKIKSTASTTPAAAKEKPQPPKRMKTLTKESMIADDFEALLPPRPNPISTRPPTPAPAPAPPLVPPALDQNRNLWELKLRMMHNVNMLPKTPRKMLQPGYRRMYTVGPFPTKVYRADAVVSLISRVTSHKLAVLPLPFRGCPRVFRLG